MNYIELNEFHKDIWGVKPHSVKDKCENRCRRFEGCPIIKGNMSFSAMLCQKPRMMKSIKREEVWWPIYY